MTDIFNGTHEFNTAKQVKELLQILQSALEEASSKQTTDTIRSAVCSDKKRLSKLLLEIEERGYLISILRLQLADATDMYADMVMKETLADSGVGVKGWRIHSVVTNEDGVFAIDANGFKECGKRPTPCDEHCTCGEYERLESVYK